LNQSEQCEGELSPCSREGGAGGSKFGVSDRGSGGGGVRVSSCSREKGDKKGGTGTAAGAFLLKAARWRGRKGRGERGPLQAWPHGKGGGGMRGALARWSVAWGGGVAARIGKEAGAGN
jgi:hypothetical protein